MKPNAKKPPQRWEKESALIIKKPEPTLNSLKLILVIQKQQTQKIIYTGAALNIISLKHLTLLKNKHNIKECVGKVKFPDGSLEEMIWEIYIDF